MSNEFEEEKRPPSGHRNSAIHQEESLRWAREHESRASRKRQEDRKKEPERGRSRKQENLRGRLREEKIWEQETAAAAEPDSEERSRKKTGASRTRRRIITMIIAECFALLFIFGYGFVARRWNMIQRLDDWQPEEVQNQNFSVDLPQYEKQKGHWGIYIFGVDSRGSNVSKGTNADVNMICDINHDTGEVKLVSVFRDTYLNIDDDNDYNKINHAYFTGGPNDAAKALNKNLDLNITDFVTFNWKAVADGINILGGVDMEISRAEFYYINSFITETVEATGVYSTHLKQAGMNHLDGVQAVAYGRLRLMDTDYARTERQRKVIQAAFEKAKTADWATLNQLAVTIFPQVATSVDLQDIIGLLTDVGKYYIGDTGGFPFARGDANMGRKGACVIPQSLESNVIELHEFLYGEENYTPSSTVKQISAKISSDTGMYTQGVSIDHVSTTGGVIPRQTTAAATTKEETEEKTTEKDTTEEETRKEDSEEKSSQEESTEKETAEKETVKKEPPGEKESKETEEEDAKESSKESGSGQKPGEEKETSESALRPGRETESSSEEKESRPTRPGSESPSLAPVLPTSEGERESTVEDKPGESEVLTIPEGPPISDSGPTGARSSAAAS